MPRKNSAQKVIYYEADRILNEKVEKGKKYFLVRWEGTDDHGRKWASTWEPESFCNAELIKHWEETKPATTTTVDDNEKKGRSPTLNNFSDSSSFKTTTTPNNKRKRETCRLNIDYSSEDDNNVNVGKVEENINSYTKNTNSLLHCDQFNKSPANLLNYNVSIPTTITYLQQKIYHKIISNPELYECLNESEYLERPEARSLILSVHNSLLSVLNHVSLYISSDLSSTLHNWFRNENQCGKLIVLKYFLSILKDLEINFRIGISVPVLKMMDIMSDFLRREGFQCMLYNRNYENKKVNDKMIFYIFVTDEVKSLECQHFNFVIAYDPRFNTKKHLCESRCNNNLPVIRLITMNTIEQSMFPLWVHDEAPKLLELSCAQIRDKLTFGIQQTNQFIEIGTVPKAYDFRRSCERVVSWINDIEEKKNGSDLISSIKKIL
ncbi:21091_t:CDS:2 [Entrophospora sp. SA101]|nr:21091_t:CDS:2 [Entrophospora sp. SA101]CAJ0830166.1 14174_t:CDS:2 [Entrophospora sp. SA101]CAJ0918430.1 5033_t:CDS:2 [Entrophospora sp. SA101]CAJ0918435.1 5037_t:CDS:2 [Entrophospora sp. SA101]